MSSRAVELLAAQGVRKHGDGLAHSGGSFPDGAHYRIEVASTEGPACLQAVIDAARDYGVTVHRVSQGSGVGMLTDAELREMNALARANGMEVSLFARPTAGWGTSAMARSPLGAVSAAAVQGSEGLAAAMTDVVRAADFGFRSVLVSDVGLLAALGEARRAGLLPADMQAKVSVMLPVANPATARLVTGLGADTINVPTDLTVGQLAEIRGATSVPLDVYVEAPDNVGGFVRHHEVVRIVEVAAPVYVKIGLRNAPDLYPSGTHLEATAVALCRERVRRAALVLDRLREHPHLRMSSPGAEGLAIPVPSG